MSFGKPLPLTCLDNILVVKVQTIVLEGQVTLKQLTYEVK